MNILVTGAKGFVGKNLVQNLLNIKDGKNQTRKVHIDEVFEYDIDSEKHLFELYCQNADFVILQELTDLKTMMTIWKGIAILFNIYLICWIKIIIDAQ